nr:AAA family ATPase [Paenibacillus xylanexedens]
MLKGIEIKGLFGRFNYYISLKDEGVTIITGPNGYGKSTILKCFEAISEGNNFSFFMKLDFTKINFLFSDDNDSFFIIKEEDGLNINGVKVPRDLLSKLSLESRIPAYIRKINDDIWIDRRTGETIEPIDFLFKRAVISYERDNIDIEVDHNLPKELHNILNQIKESIGPIYYIKEQRLIMEKRNGNTEIESINVIDELPNKFKNLIRDISNNYSATANKLDGSYPYRLFKTEKGISEEDYKIKMEEMNEKFEKLRKYDISDMQNSANVVFKNEHAKALKIYFDDFDKKYKVYEDFINKLDIFTDIVNNRLSFKEIKISREFGIIVTDKEFKEKPIRLNQLSSGEKQEIVLFYELIFETTNDVLLLIDEPEISLHITWQKSFMNDLLKTVNYKKFKVIVATHSPQIINNHWDKQIDLGELYSEQLG